MKILIGKDTNLGRSLYLMNKDVYGIHWSDLYSVNLERYTDVYITGYDPSYHDEVLVDILLDKIPKSSHVFLFSSTDVVDAGSNETSAYSKSYMNHLPLITFEIKLREFDNHHILRFPTNVLGELVVSPFMDKFKNRLIVNLTDDLQFYDFEFINKHLETIKYNNIQIAHMISEPISVRTIMDACYPEYTLVAEYLDRVVEQIQTVHRKLVVASTSVSTFNNYMLSSSAIISKVSYLKKLTQGITTLNTNRVIASSSLWEDAWKEKAMEILSHFGITKTTVSGKQIDWFNLNIHQFKVEMLNNNVVVMEDMFGNFKAYNAFTNSEQFLSHFKKTIDIAKLCNISYVVLSDSSSRFITSNTSDEFWNADYARHNIAFVSTMKRLASYASTKNVIVLLMANNESNFLKTEEECIAFVNAVNLPSLRFASVDTLCAGGTSIGIHFVSQSKLTIDTCQLPCVIYNNQKSPNPENLLKCLVTLSNKI